MWSLPKSQGADHRCSIGESDKKAGSASRVLAGAPQKAGERLGDDLSPGRKSKKQSPDTPLRYVTGFNII